MIRAEAPLAALDATAFRVPTDAPEGDGTLTWDATTLVVVEVAAGGARGVGYTYADACLVPLLRGLLSRTVEGMDALDPPAAWRAMTRAVRNLGRSGLVATAISAVDAAIWDVKAKLFDAPLALLLGRARDSVEIYGSGGFTTYSDDRLARQLSGWVERDGCRHVKMKVGADPARDPARVSVARRAIGDADLFVDANGAFDAKTALAFARRVAEAGVIWFEEPVSSDDAAGLAFVRREGPAGMEIAAGEYGYTPDDFVRLLDGACVDCLQADATRCGGVTGFLRVAALCEARHIDLSGHCAPAMHLAPACAAPRLRHLEWFHDHVRIEHMLFDGAPTPRDGRIAPDLTRPGNGLELRRADAAPYAIG